MIGGEVVLAIITGGAGWAIADFADRYLATYQPSTTTTAPANMFYGGTGTEANTLNLAMPPSIMRMGAAAGQAVLWGLGAVVVKNRMGKAALQGMMIGAGIKLFQLIWNGYVMPKVLKPSANDATTLQGSLGARLYPAEITAAQNIANSPATYSSPTGLNPGLAGAPRPQGVGQDVGPFAGPPGGANAAPPANVLQPPPPAQVLQQIPPPAPQPTAKPPGDCGCLGDRMPQFLGFMSAA